MLSLRVRRTKANAGSVRFRRSQTNGPHRHANFAIGSAATRILALVVAASAWVNPSRINARQSRSMRAILVKF
jgi:hypothetical protein